MDTHWRTATALGLVNHERNKENKVDTVIREGSKGFRYAFLYGAGVTRAGMIVAGIVRAVRKAPFRHTHCWQAWLITALSATDAVVLVDANKLTAHSAGDVPQFPLLIGGGLIDRRNPKIKHRAFHRDPPPN